MSIINEALKKTEISIQKNEAIKDAPAKEKVIKRPVLLYILILIGGLFIGNLIFGLLTRKIQAPNMVKALPPVQITPTVQQQTQAVQALPIAPSLPNEENKIIEPEIAEKPDFVLNGIFISDNDGYALINNQITRENETVDGATVKKITADSVELDLGGVIKTLSTRR